MKQLAFSLQKMARDLLFRVGARSPEAFRATMRALPPSIPTKLRALGFRRTMRLAAARAPFYRRRFAELGIDARTVSVPEELGDFFVAPEELRADPGSFLCERADTAIESSGTTGHAARVYLSRRELEYNARQALLLRAVWGIADSDRVLSTFDYGFCLDGQLAHQALPHWRCFVMCAGRAEPVEAYHRLRAYEFNIVMSGTPWLSRFTEVAEVEGRPFPLKLLVGGGGGGIMPWTRARIEEFWQAPLCMTYGLTEVGTLLGFECLRRDGYHLNEFDFFVEILNPDREGYGEVVITTVNRRVMPLIRYRTGDIARMLEGRCSCGLPFRRLSPLRGRLDEIVASVWGNVHPDFFERILGNVRGLGEDWQVALHEKDGKQSFQFRLELENGHAREAEMREQILQKVQNEHPLAWNACVQKLAGVEFVFVPKGSLRKGRKLLRLVDERRSVNSEQ